MDLDKYEKRIILRYRMLKEYGDGVISVYVRDGEYTGVDVLEKDRKKSWDETPCLSLEQAIIQNIEKGI